MQVGTDWSLYGRESRLIMWTRTTEKSPAPHTIDDLLVEQTLARALTRSMLGSMPYLLVLDHHTLFPQTEGKYQFALLWRHALLPIAEIVGSDEWLVGVLDQAQLFEICDNPRLWERVSVRGILDLRTHPERFYVVGRRHMPYMTEYDIRMKMVE